MSKSRSQLIELLKNIDVTGKTVLDIGAGPKEKWARNFTKGEPKEYITLDYVASFGCDLVADLNKPVAFGEEFRIPTADVVFCLETLEHIYDPMRAVRNLSNFTRESGVLYISTPFINPIHDTWDYMRYTFQWFEKVLPIYGFKDIKITPRVATETDPDDMFSKTYLQQFYESEGMRMSKVTQQMGYGNHLLDIGYFVECHK